MDVLKNLENAVIDCFMVPNELLPESYQGKRTPVSYTHLRAHET